MESRKRGSGGQENRESGEILDVRPEGKEQNIEMVKGIIQEMVDDVPSGTDYQQAQVHKLGVNPVQGGAQEESGLRGSQLRRTYLGASCVVRTEGTQVQVHRSGVGPVHEGSQDVLIVQETMDEEDIPWCVVCYGEGSKGNPLGEVTWGDTPEDVPCWMCRRCRQRGTSPVGWSDV